MPTYLLWHIVRQDNIYCHIVEHIIYNVYKTYCTYNIFIHVFMCKTYCTYNMFIYSSIKRNTISIFHALQINLYSGMYPQVAITHRVSTSNGACILIATTSSTTSTSHCQDMKPPVHRAVLVQETTLGRIWDAMINRYKCYKIEIS